MSNHPIEALLRPPVEWATSLGAISLAAIIWRAPDIMMMTRPVAVGVAVVMLVVAVRRFFQGWKVVKYQRGLRKMPRYVLPLSALKHDPQGLFLGQGFRWTSRHTQRLWDATRAYNQHYVEQRNLRQRLQESWSDRQPMLFSGLPALHGVGLLETEKRIVLPRSERAGHIFYVGTTGVGKTRAAEVAVVQDIRSGSPVVFMDPKGDPDIFRRMFTEAKKAKRPFYFFHLGYPQHSVRYNPLSRFSRITEVATRISNQLPKGGNAEAFRQFAWLFTNMIARALVALGEKPDYRKILRHMNRIEPLLVRYYEHMFNQHVTGWEALLNDASSKRNRQGLPQHMKERDPRALALVRLYDAQEFNDPVADVLRRAFEFEKSFFDKISVAVQPLLEKLLAGDVGEILNPDYTSDDEQRPILEWPNVIRQRAVVYCGFDALTEPEVASVVGQSMIADLVSYAGEIYKHGFGSHLPSSEQVPETYIHLDEVSELIVGSEIIQGVNKGRGAGLRFSLYTQTLSDLAAGLGDREKAQQVIGNVTNTIVMMRVANRETAELLTERLGQVEVNALMLVSGATDSSTPDSNVDFVSTTQERISTQTATLIEPGHAMQLPRGHAFVLMAGSQLFKVRMPEIAEPTNRLPADLEAIADDMARRYQSAPVSGQSDEDDHLKNILMMEAANPHSVAIRQIWEESPNASSETDEADNNSAQTENESASIASVWQNA